MIRPQPPSLAVGPRDADPQDRAAPAAAASADGVVCFAGVDWWYHNRGHSECQIMRRLAAQVPVLWINSIGMRLPAPGRSDLIWTRYARKLRSTLKGLRRDPSGMWVYSPLFVPRFTRRAVAMNARLLDAQVAVLLRGLGIRRPSAFVTVPTAGPAVERRRYQKTVFNRSDAFSEFPEVDGRLIGELERRLLARADEVIYVNQALLARERGAVRRAHFVDHGVDFEHFAAARGPHGPLRPPPPALAGLARPLIGFYGALDGYTVDLDLLVRVARAYPSATLLVIGPQAMEIDPLLREPNVRYLGPVPYEELPDYAAHFDVGLMPWLRNDWIAACNPIKLKEYLALGFPVVSTRYPQLAPYEDLVEVADDAESFVACVGRALADRDPAAAERRRERVRNDSWDAVARRVGRLLGVLPE
jgi:glycosyltransferase involved in cell wall biosynthesis